jgi:hypothetical protein
MAVGWRPQKIRPGSGADKGCVGSGVVEHHWPGARDPWDPRWPAAGVDAHAARDLAGSTAVGAACVPMCEGEPHLGFGMPARCSTPCPKGKADGKCSPAMWRFGDGSARSTAKTVRP